MNDTKPAEGGTSKDIDADERPVAEETSGKDDAEGAVPVPRLHTSIARIRNSMAERQDAFEDLRERERALLQALDDQLQAFADDIPREDDWVLLSLSNGERPRYWVDPTSHVSVARDSRTFRFLRDTRIGRIVVREDDDVKVIAQSVADFIAERIVERERAIDGDWLAAVQSNYDDEAKRKDEKANREITKPAKKRSGFGVYLFGLISGLALMFAIWAYEDPAIVETLSSRFATVLEPLNAEMQSWFRSE